MSEEFSSTMSDVLSSINKISLSEESYAILGILSLLSPDRGEGICERDRQQLNSLQVCSKSSLICSKILFQEIFANILRKHMRGIGADNPIEYSKGKSN